MLPEDLHCDHTTFRNYAGVEAHDITEDEMTNHIEKGHVAAFDSYEELAEYTGGKPILSKLGIIEKIRNGISSARTILDTKESGVKWITAKTQRVILPRLFDAVLTLLMLLAINTDAGCTTATVGAFVLDFSEALWQIPICREEQRFFCATATVKGLSLIHI